MIPEIDIWRAAGVMVKRYGKDAALEAARRADEFETQGDLYGQRVWLRIGAAIDALQNVAPGETKQ